MAVDHLNDNARNLIQFTFKYIFIIALLTGMRLSEILHLKWEDMKDDVFYVRRNKEGVEKFAPIPLVLKGILRELEGRGGDYVIPMGRRRSDAIRNTWNEVKRIARVDSRFHDLRRTYKP